MPGRRRNNGDGMNPLVLYGLPALLVTLAFAWLIATPAVIQILLFGALG